MLFTKYYSFFKKSFFLKDKIIASNLIMSLVSIFTLLFLFTYKIKLYKLSSNSQLLLHYNVYFGIDWIGSWYKILIYPIIGFLLFIINLLLSSYFYNRKNFLSYLLVCSMTFGEILVLISGLAVLWINS